MADKKKDDGRFFTVGPATQHIQHRKDGRNYWPGEVFSLTHLDPDIVEKLLKNGDVVDVTGKDQKQIMTAVKAYPGIKPAEVAAALRRTSSSGKN